MSEQQPDAADTDAPTASEADEDSSSTSSGSAGSASAEGSVSSGEPGDVGDDQLPEDLQPSEDNPLARHPEQTGESNDEIGTDREEEPETAPLTREDADYGGAGGSE